MPLREGRVATSVREYRPHTEAGTEGRGELFFYALKCDIVARGEES